MKRRFNEEQIIGILKEAEAARPAEQAAARTTRRLVVGWDREKALTGGGHAQVDDGSVA
ncbi:hypothetical protein [Burkholderia sp. D-99]|uniref:hypothetical protein n=1 Tax=Burkholderia sp. D-99 TaxID=2717316 RepID=UPI00141DD6B3|nr:hypothetical protein [Burkholderia sp. D-99]NHV26875.1 hypothetical protein [Burkholderia sp. D-99]